MTHTIDRPAPVAARGLTPGQFVVRFPAGRIEGRHGQFVARCLVDTLAAAIAGANEGSTRLILEEARDGAARAPGPGAASSWISQDTFGEEAAALANAVVAHAFDLDDVTDDVRGHISSILLPALVAMAESRDLSGAAVVDAYVLGFEVACRLGRLVFDSHYTKGWHSTSTLGAIAGAAACSRLIGLDEAAADAAIGLAVAQAGGTRANFGSMGKPLQAGHAARAAVQSARLAARGFTAGADPLTGPYGFTQLYAAGEAEPALFALPTAGNALAIDAVGVIVKKYPMCYAAHRAVDAMLELREEQGLRPDQVTAIDVESSAAGHGPLVHHRPRTPTEAMFSMEYGVAAALADGRMGCSSFTGAALARATIADLMAKVTMREAGGPILPPWSTVRVTKTDGQVLERRIAALRGSHERPLRQADLLAKLVDCLAYAGREGDARQLMDAVMSMPSVSIRALLAGPAWRALRGAA